VTTFQKNREMSGNFTAVREMSRISVTIREMSGKILSREIDQKFFLKIASTCFWYHWFSTLCHLFYAVYCWV